jgi:DnaJ-class molecular chaperone
LDDLAVLGLKEGAARKEIKSAFRELAKKYHPDRIGPGISKSEAAEQFLTILGAYERLLQSGNHPAESKRWNPTWVSSGEKNRRVSSVFRFAEICARLVLIALIFSFPFLMIYIYFIVARSG